MHAPVEREGTIKGTERELNALMQLLDAAVRSLGLRGAADAVMWTQKIQMAMREMAVDAKTEPSSNIVDDGHP